MTVSQGSCTAVISSDFFNLIAGLVGRPWVSAAQGPEAFDCYGLVRYLQAHAFGVEMPAVHVVHEEIARSVRAFREMPIQLGWKPTGFLTHGDLVLMSQHTQPHHIGQYFDLAGERGVIHCLEGQGVIIDSMESLVNKGWRLQGITLNGSNRNTEQSSGSD